MTTIKKSHLTEKISYKYMINLSMNIIKEFIVRNKLFREEKIYFTENSFLSTR